MGKRHRRLTALAMAALLLLGTLTFPAGAAESAQLSLSSGTVAAGDSVTLTLTMERNPGLAAMLVYFYYDTTMFTLEPSRDLATAGAFRGSGGLTGNTIALARQNGRYNGETGRDGALALWLQSSGSNVYDTGACMTITLHAKAEAVNGTYAIGVGSSPEDVCNEDGEYISLSATGGTVTITGGLPEGTTPQVITPPGGTAQPETTTQSETMTAAQRLESTLILQIGSFAAVDGGVLTAIDADNHAVTPVINEDDRTLIPVRFVAEALGADVTWDGQARRVTLTLEGKTIVMTIGRRDYTVNGETYTMDTAPEIRQAWDRTLVPLRFVMEALGRGVEWDAAARLVLITPADSPWDLNGEVEAQAKAEAMTLLALRAFL